MATDRPARKREEDEVERLSKENRELKAINRSLMKQLKKLAKGIHKEEVEQALERLEDAPEEKDPRERSRICPKCGRRGLCETIIAGRSFERCNICDYKSGRIK